MSKTYRRKSYDIQAVEWTGENLDEVKEFLNDPWIRLSIMDETEKNPFAPEDSVTLRIAMAEGTIYADNGDMILKDQDREIRVVRKDVFDRIYEEVPES